MSFHSEYGVDESLFLADTIDVHAERSRVVRMFQLCELDVVEPVRSFHPDPHFAFAKSSSICLSSSLPLSEYASP